MADGAVPSDKLRRLEVEANQAFETYRELYVCVVCVCVCVVCVYMCMCVCVHTLPNASILP